MAYTHLTNNERFYIEKLLAENISISYIAKELGRDKSTLSRELNLNTDKSFGFYSGLRADNIAIEKEKLAKRKNKKIDNLSSKVFENFMGMLMIEHHQIK